MALNAIARITDPHFFILDITIKKAHACKHMHKPRVHTHACTDKEMSLLQLYVKVLGKADRVEKKNPEQTFLTMCHPAMFTLITGSQVNLPWLKTFTRAIYQCTADGLEKETENTY